MTANLESIVNAVRDGVLAVPVCPFRGEGIDEGAAQRLIGTMAHSGVDGVVPCGNTSEYYSLSPAEVEQFARIAVGAAEGRVPVIVGVGGDPATAIRQAAFAEKIGAQGIMIHEPVAPYASPEGIVEYIRSIADSVSIAAFPYIRKDFLATVHFGEIFESPNVVGVKHATNNLDSVAELVATFPKQLWICGSAESWAPFYALAGAKGFTSGLAGFRPELPLRLRDQLKANDFLGAIETWRTIRPFERLRTGVNNAYNVSTIKEAMRLLGIDVGDPRLPATRPTEAMARQIVEVLEGWGLHALEDRQPELR